MRVRMMLILTALILAAAPSTARADGFVSPFLGVNFANPSANGRANFGVDAGYMGGGVFGAELDLGYAPNFFGSQGDFGNNNVFTLMGNAIVGIPIGGTLGPSVRPFVSGGVGLIRETVNGPVGATRIANNDFGVNLGGGVMGYFTNHVGVRGDLRYYRDLKDNSTTNNFNIDFGSFHFWRASIGVTFK